MYRPLSSPLTAALLTTCAALALTVSAAILHLF